MREIFNGWNNRKYTSRVEIENMKKNMKKVPIIQKIAEEYHKSEEIEADEFIKNNIDVWENIKIEHKDEKNTNVGIINKIIKKIKNLFKNILKWLQKI